MPAVNNVIRMLDARKIPYTAFETPVEKLGAAETAHFLKVPVGTVFKTIVVTRRGGGKPVLALVPGDREVDLRLLASSLGEKRLELPTERQAEQITGLKAGGISPLALINRGFQVVIEESARQFVEIHVSGGQRGLNLRISVQDLATLTNAEYAGICRQT